MASSLRMKLAETALALGKQEKVCQRVQRKFLEARRLLYTSKKGSEAHLKISKEFKALRIQLAREKEKWSEVRDANGRAREQISNPAGGEVAKPEPLSMDAFFSESAPQSPKKRKPGEMATWAKKIVKKKTKVPKMKGHRIALTFGDAGENHVGMEQLGQKQTSGSGFTTRDLQQIKKHSEQAKYKCELVELSGEDEKGAGEDAVASVLVIRRFAKPHEAEKMRQELVVCDWDNKFWDTRRKKVLNKRARSNLMFLHGVQQEPDYAEGKGTIVDLDTLQHVCQAETKFAGLIRTALKHGKSKTKWVPLVCEGNNYFDSSKCGIGFHGDTERTRVICLSLGTTNNYPMRWLAFRNSKVVAGPFDLKLNVGDLYIMSELAVGSNWKKRKELSFRHAAGAPAYVKVKPNWLPAEEVAKTTEKAEKKTEETEHVVDDV